MSAGFNLLQRAQASIEKHMIRKAAFTTTDLTTGGGLLSVQQAKRFVQMMRFKPSLLRYCRVVSMPGPTFRIDRIYFPNRILHAASENTNLAASNQSVPTTSKLELTAKLYKAEIQLSYENLQDNIEGGINVRGNQFEDTIFRLITEACAIDIEEYGLLSDTASATTDYTSQDGWLKLAQAQNSYDHSGAAVNKAFFKQTYRQLPKAYRQDKNQLLWVVGPNMDIEWADEQADRTTTTGDSVPWGDRWPNRAYGIRMLSSGKMPEESGSSSNLGKVLISHPKNIITGIWRNIYLEVDRDIRAGSLIVVCSVRLAFQFEQVEGACVGYNVSVA